MSRSSPLYPLLFLVRHFLLKVTSGSSGTFLLHSALISLLSRLEEKSVFPLIVLVKSIVELFACIQSNVCITHIQQQWYSFKICILWRKLEHNFNHSERIKPWRTFEHFKVKSCSNAKAYGAKSTSAIPQRNLSQRVAARLTRNTISLYSSQSQQQ